jgi:hypothetical protein
MAWKARRRRSAGIVKSMQHRFCAAANSAADSAADSTEQRWGTVLINFLIKIFYRSPCRGQTAT